MFAVPFLVPELSSAMSASLEVSVQSRERRLCDLLIAGGYRETRRSDDFIDFEAYDTRAARPTESDISMLPSNLADAVRFKSMPQLVVVSRNGKDDTGQPSATCSMVWFRHQRNMVAQYEMQSSEDPSKHGQAPTVWCGSLRNWSRILENHMFRFTEPVDEAERELDEDHVRF